MSAPSASRRTICVPLSGMHAGEGYVSGFRLDHLREEGGALVCAEGTEEAYTLPDGTTDLFCAEEELFAYRGGHERAVRMLNNMSYVAEGTLLRMTNNVGPTGTNVMNAICDETLYHYENMSGSADFYTPTKTTTNVVLHHERLFGATAKRMYYTKAGDVRTWAQPSETGAGWCDLPAGIGDAVDIVAMRGNLYFLCEYGISRFTGYADVYNFKFSILPCRVGKIVSYAAQIGGNAYFFSERGLCVFDGSVAERAPGADDGDIDLSAPIRVDRWRDKLAASVTCRDGTAALYIYEPSCARGRFLRLPFEKMAAGREMYLMREGKAYRLQGRAMPSGASLTAQFDLSPLGGGEKRLEGVYAEGNGTLRAEAFGDDGVRRACTGEAGAWMDFAAGIRGERVTLRLSSEDEDIAIRSLVLRVRKEDRL